INPNERHVLTATIGTVTSDVVYYSAQDSDKYTWSLIKFTNVYFDDDTLISADLDAPGNNLKPVKIGAVFELNYIRYFDSDGTVALFSDPFMSSQTADIRLKHPDEFKLTKDGYNFDGWSTEFSPTVKMPTYDPYRTIPPPSDKYTDLYAVWTARDDLSYVVNYLEQGTNKVLADQKVEGDQVFGTKVTACAIDITGYNKVDPTEVTITIAVSGNVITFYYESAIATIIYAPGEQGNFALDVHDDCIIGDDTPVFRGDLTNCELGYEFDYWAPAVSATVTDDAMYVAQWKQIDYKIEFKLGDNTMGDYLKGTLFSDVHYNDPMPTPPHPYAKFGYKFLGWQGDDGSFIRALDYTKPTELTGYPETVTGSVTYTAQWSLVNEKQTFPDKIPSEQHFDQWWAEYGILCVSSSTTKDDNYAVYFADWFFDVYDSCTIAFGANAKKFDYEIVFKEDSIILWQLTGNGGRKAINSDLELDQHTVIRDGMHYTKEKNHNYGLDFGMGGTLKGVSFVNPFGSGAKLAWLC
ncbi:MAG: InlB B-repeat-containing protein, partial [Nitrososphaerota archaeon]|nr:InlB B-repeat-containing protein [Nitrososphaerota archaeon]